MNSARKVLFIGAKPATVSLYSSHLEPAGFSLASASLGDPILEKVRESKPEALLLDLSSPSSTGTDALRRIRSEPAFASLPLFVMSNGTVVEPADELARDSRVKVFQESSAPAADVARAIEEILNARKASSLSPTIPQARLPGNGDVEADDGLSQAGLPVTKKLSEAVRTFCRTSERERRIDLLAVMRQEARGLRRAFSASNFETLANFTSALERLFTALSKDVGAVNSSTLKTVSHAMDFLTKAAASNTGRDEMTRTPILMLAVDDDPVCLRTLMMVASNHNGVRLVACDGAEPALRQLKAGDFDLILSDILMPVMDGFEFVAEVRKLPKHRTTPVVFLTALSDFETRSRSVLSGGCDLIAKPFTAGEVLVKALTLGLKRRFDSAAAVAHAIHRPKDVSPNGTAPDSELPPPNNGGNGYETSAPASLAPKGPTARGVLVVEEDGGIRSMNMAAAQLLGYNPDEAANGDVRALIPDELQSEENRTLLDQALAGTVKHKSGIKMTGRRKDNSTVQLLVSVGETWVGRQRSIMCLLQPASPPVVAKQATPARAVDAKSAPAESTAYIEPRNTTLAELVRAKEYWEACAAERAALLEEQRNRLRGQDRVVEDLRRESDTLKESLERQTKEHLERQNELRELVRAKEYWEGCASERAALLEEQKNRLRGHDCTVEDLRREGEALKAFCKARVAELQQTRTLLERQAKEHLERQSELQCRCATIQAQLDSLIESRTKEATGGAASEPQSEELAASAKREEDLRTELKAAKAALAELEKNRMVLGQELGQAQAKVGELGSRARELEGRLGVEVGQRETWERQAAELDRARVALEGEIREWTKREGQLKSECARLEQQGQGLTESLSQTQASLAKEAAGRKAAEQQAAELADLRKALEQQLVASREREEDLRAGLKAAQAASARLDKNRTASGKELSEAHAKVGELVSRVNELEGQFRAEVGQRENWERRAAELEQAKVALEGQIREWTEREDQLKSECTQLEQQGQGLIESLSQTQASLAQEAAGRKAAEQQAGELAELRRALEHQLTASRKREQNLRAGLKAAEATVADLEKDRTALGHQLGQAQAKVGEFTSRMGEQESLFRAEVGQRQNMERRAAELKQAQVALQGEIREWAKREGQLKSECARLEQQGQGLTEALSQTQASLAKEAAGRKAAEQQAGELAELRRALEQRLAASREREEKLRAGLKAAEAAVAGLEKNRMALGQELGQAHAKVGELTSRFGELESQFRAEVGQRENWERQAAELKQAQAALQSKIRERAKREDQLKSECARLEQQGQGLTESLSQTQASLAKEVAGRTAAEQQAGELTGLRKALEQQLTASQKREQDLRAGLKAAEAEVAGLEKNRTALGQELGQAQAKIGELTSRLGEQESQSRTEMGQRENWERRAAELEQARVALEGKIQEGAKREEQFKSECFRLEQQGQGLAESLSQTQASLVKEAAGRNAAVQQAGELAELRKALEQQLAASREREESLRAGLKAAEAEVAGLEKNRTALGQELGQAQTKVGELTSRLGELESQLQAELGQRENWERRAAELDQARVALEGKIQKGAEREAQSKSECARLEQQGQGLTESLSQTQASLVQEAAGRKAAEQQAGELAELRRALEQQLAASREREENLRAGLKTAEAAVAGLEKNRTALVHELGQAQTKVGELISRLGELESQLRAEVGQHENWERRAAELEQARVALEGNIQEGAKREERLKSECVRLEQQGQGLTESLSQTQASLAKEVAARSATEQQAAELAELRRALEQELAASRKREENLQAGLKAAEAAVAGLEKNRIALGQELGQAQAKVGELTSRLEELEGQLGAEVGQRENWERRAAELEQARVALKGNIQEGAKREERLKSECVRLEQQGQGLTESLSQTQASLAKEVAARTAAEQQVAELAELRSALEPELARRKESEQKLQSELSETRAQLQTTIDSLSAQQSLLDARTRELKAAHAALAERVQQEHQLKGDCARLDQELRAVAESLAQSRAQFAAEAKHRAAAESQAGELAESQRALEQELTRRKETEEKLQSELREWQAQLQFSHDGLSAQQSHLEARTRELQTAQATLRELTAAKEVVANDLSAAREQLQHEELQRRRLAGMVLEEQDAKAELSKQLQAVCERDQARQRTIAELEAEGQKNLKALRTVESSLDSESTQRRRLQSQLDRVEARLGETSRQLELKHAAELHWRQREAELEASAHRLQEQVVSSAATITIREEEIRSTRARLEESLLIQSALCGKVNDLASRESSLAQCQKETNEQLAMAQQKIGDGHKELAALRYAVLDAQRLRLQMDRKRNQGTRQRLGGLQEVTSVLLNTPLSMAQRSVANSLKAALVGWIGDCGLSADQEAFPVETPSFQTSEFSLAQVTESAIRQIAESAAQTSVKASTIISGNAPDRLCGDGGHIHQLITLLADSLMRSPNARTLAVRVQVNREPPAAAELNVHFAIQSDTDLKEAAKSFARTIAGSCTPEAAQLGEVESSLVACRHLATAMGGSLQFDAPGDKEVNFRLAVPVGTVEPIRSAEPASTAQPAEQSASRVTALKS